MSSHSIDPAPAQGHTCSRTAALPQRRHQRGIGLLGFIVGIVVGLAVALAVAVYITKVPTPFTDKSKAKTAEEQAAEEARLKSWNPNGPLASKTPSPSASGHVQPAPGSTPPAAVQPPAITKAPNQPLPPAAQGTDGDQGVLGDREQELARAKAEAEAKLKADLRAQELARAKAKAEEDRRRDEINASSDPIGALLQERSRQQAAANTNKAPAAPAPSGGSGGSNEAFVYYVQVGAFRDPNGADSQKARLSMLGLSARINERQQSGRTVYQVRLGPFQSKREADAARSRVENGGLETALVRVQR
ncbi:MAG: SPOR domain-containing protein [Brachymonas sp.]|nr:SPOR domain-containing protein [Brachymonas sp.]